MAYIHLQGIGEKPAVQAGTLKKGTGAVIVLSISLVFYYF